MSQSFLCSGLKKFCERRKTVLKRATRANKSLHKVQAVWKLSTHPSRHARPSIPSPSLNRHSITPFAICKTFQTLNYVRLFVAAHKTQPFEEKANVTGSADKNEKTSEPCTLTTHNWIKLQIIALNDCEVIFREFRNTLR